MQVIAEEGSHRRTVVIAAFEKDGTREEREVEPYSLRPGQDHMRLMFWCLKRGDWRSLLLPNIVSARATGHSFAPRAPIEF